MSKRAATYIRMSSTQQEDSPERQLQQILPYCQRKGYTIVKSYQDLAWKGYDDSRPEFQKLIAAAKRKEFQVVVVDEQSRLARSEAFDYLELVAIPLRKAGITLDTVSNGVTDWFGLAGQILTLVGQHKAHDEVLGLSRRVVTGMIRRLEEGGRLGGQLPYGYKLEQGQIIIDEIPAGNVKRIFDWCIRDHLSLFQISQKLDGITKSPRGRRWSRAHVRNILKNPFYVGDWVFNRSTTAVFFKFSITNERATAQKRELPEGKVKRHDRNPESEWIVRRGNHSPIIDRDTFRRAGELLAGNRERRGSIKAAATYVASGLIWCATCGAKFVGCSKKGGIPSYVCGSYVNSGLKSCRPYSIAQDDLVELLLTVISSHYGDPTRLDLLKQEARRLVGQGGYQKELSEAKAAMASSVAKVKKGWDNLLLLDSDMIPEAKRRIREWESEVILLRDKIARLNESDPLSDYRRAAEEVEQNLARLSDLGGEATKRHPDRLMACLRDVVQRATLTFKHVTAKAGKRTFYRLAHADVILSDGAEARIEPEGDRPPMGAPPQSAQYECWGDSKTLLEWSRDPRCFVGFKCLWHRVKRRGWGIQKALETASK